MSLTAAPAFWSKTMQISVGSLPPGQCIGESRSARMAWPCNFVAETLTVWHDRKFSTAFFRADAHRQGRTLPQHDFRGYNRNSLRVGLYQILTRWYCLCFQACRRWPGVWSSVRFDIETKILQQKIKILPLKNDDFGATRCAPCVGESIRSAASREFRRHV